MRTTNTLLSQTRKINPPERLLPSEWAEQNVVLPDGRMAGQRIKLYPFQKEMLDIIDNSQYRKVVYKTSAQIAKTTLLNCALFYWIANDSSNIGIAQSSLAELKQWRTGKILKTIEYSPTLQPLITDQNDKARTNNQNQIELTSGDFMYFMTLGSAKALRGKTCKRIILDEIAACEQSEEGNPIRLAEQRVTEFGDEAKILLSSTPTFAGDPIDVEYQNSDQREWFIKCPHCNHEHTIKWENVRFDWRKQGRREVPVPDTANLHCPECQHVITESERIKAVSTGRWIAQNPQITDTAGFFINRLYASNATITNIVKEFATAFYEFNLQSFYNTVLGLHYSSLQDELEELELETLREPFSIKAIPDDVLGIVFGTDQQLDRLECTTMGIGCENLYVLDHRIFYDVNCELRSSRSYVDLANYIKSPFKTVSGRKIPILQCAIDSSNGRATKTIYSVCANNPKFKAIKGSSSTKSELFKKSKSEGYEFYILNVHELKCMSRQLLNNAAKEIEAPQRLRFSDTLCDDYFDQLLAEELKRKGNSVVWQLIPGRRNECLDTLGYCLAMMKLSFSKLGKDPYARLGQYGRRNEAVPNVEEVSTETVTEPERKQRQKRIRKPNPFL